MEVLPGVHSLPVGRSTPPSLFPPTVYLVVGGRGAVFIDSGYGEDAPARLEMWRALGSPPVRALLLTHCHPDHIGGAPALHRATGAPLLCHPWERPVIDAALEKAGEALRIHGTVADGEPLDLGGLTLEAVHTPGHTRGSLCVYLREARALFTGDTVLGLGTTVVDPEEGDMALYMASLRRLLDYPVDLLLPGHGPVVRQARAKVQGLLDHRREREGQVLRALADGPRDLESLCREVYPEVGPALVPLARGQVLAHLRKLMAEGRVEESSGRYRLREGGSR